MSIVSKVALGPNFRRFARKSARPPEPVPVNGAQVPLILGALALVRGDVCVVVQRSSGPHDVTGQVVKTLAELLIRQPLITSWPGVLNQMAMTASPQGQHWEFTAGPKLPLVRSPMSMSLPARIPSNAAPPFVRWLVLTGQRVLYEREIRIDGKSIPFPRVTTRDVDHLLVLGDELLALH